ncbi:MAG: hypothetical protein JST00_33475 [Deltaproteobacteria bacterium]|nr:hypothetical protein [Deltaproteobacteria bacterium]
MGAPRGEAPKERKTIMRHVDTIRGSIAACAAVTCALLTACAAEPDEGAVATADQAIGEGYGSSSTSSASSGSGAGSGETQSSGSGTGVGYGGTSTISGSTSMSSCREIDGDPHWVSKHCSGGASSQYFDYTIKCSKECGSSTAKGKYKCASASRAEFNPKATCK